MDKKTPLLSIIVPAYNEAARLPQTLPQITDFILEQPYKAELLIVDNNSKDQTRAIAREFADEFPFVKVLDEPRQGKGAAVRTGMLAASGDYLFMADADLSMPITEVNKFIPPMLSDYDVAIGSREVDGAVRYNEPEYRHVMGRVFNWIVKLLAVPRFQDTQAGFKCFRRQVALDVLTNQTVDGWAFDVELLYIALKRGYRVVEVPIHWYYRKNSRINPLEDAFEMVREVLRIRLNGLQGRYDPPSAIESVQR
ncbi:MAG TPA: dolichyl-phosphate beta-glucosyltransferase [Candidatus Binatia bacterium]|nr:dolichyl-phosphate beta-glucosyltransferase [Candidatus Binatia bacterium]